MITQEFTSEKNYYFGYIYSITEKETNKVYVGQHKGQTFDDTYWGSGALITNAIKLLGKDAFERKVLRWCYDQLELNAYEEHYAIQLNAFIPNGYNLSMSKGRGRPKMITKTKIVTDKDGDTHLTKDIIAIKNISNGMLLKWRERETKMLLTKLKYYEDIIEKLLNDDLDEDSKRIVITKFYNYKNIKFSRKLNDLYNFIKEQNCSIEELQ